MKEIVLFAQPGIIAIQLKAFSPSVHQHHAIQLTFNPTSNLTIKSYDREFSGTSIAIDSNIAHSIEADKCFILLIEPESQMGRTLRKEVLSGNTIVVIKETYRITTLQEAIELFEADRKKRHEDLDGRIAIILEKIGQIEQEGVWDSLRLADAASWVNLSKSRCRHLFNEQMNISWRRYILWRRLLAGLRLSFSAASLTQAAVNAGFADGAHFSRTCRAMFGITPNELVKYSRFVQDQRNELL